MRIRFSLLPFVFALALGSASADVVPRYPEIRRLDPTDPCFNELQRLVAEFHVASAAGTRLPDLVFFSYRVKPGDDLFSLSARLLVPYDTLVTANRIPERGALAPGAWMAVPSIPGVFVPDSPRSDLEYLMKSWRTAVASLAFPASVASSAGIERFSFYAGERFHPAERAFFLNALFRFPLPKAVVTSGFGTRANPFGSGTERHSGVDLSAPEGTEVYAARRGTVRATGWSDLYGNYVLLAHEGGWETLYGHLGSIRVRLYDQLESGIILGTVGSTGRSTGPHLHFEVRSGGVPVDPSPYLPTRAP
jgi:murein DD-endopeptidase MepM/ murein hydrolase activator NlpD